MEGQLLKLGIPIKKNIYQIFFGILLIISGGIANIFLIGMISDALQADGGQHLIDPSLFVLGLLLAFFLNVVAQYILEGVGHKIVFQIRENLLQRIVHANPDSFQQLEKS